jgi:hypothetical protein
MDVQKRQRPQKPTNTKKKAKKYKYKEKTSFATLFFAHLLSGLKIE